MAVTVTRYVNPHSSGGDGTTSALSGSTAAYASLQAAITAEASARPNLVSNDEVLEIRCATSGNADAAAVVDGFTTDSTRYVHILGDPLQAGGRHEGRWSTSHYRISTSSGTALLISTNYTRVEGIQAENLGSFQAVYMLEAGVSVSGVRFLSCLAWTRNANSAGGFLHVALSGELTAPNYCINCVSFGTQSEGHFYLRTGGTTPIYFLNCTAYGGTRGFHARGSQCHVYNCAAVGSTTAFSESQGTFLGSHVAFDQGSDPLTNGVDVSASSDADIFVDAASGDFHLAESSPLIGVGTDLSGTFGVTTDIDGETRATPWSIGADQIVSGGGGISIPVVQHFRQRIF